MTDRPMPIPDKKSATIKTVAAELGLSLATVSRAMRNDARVHPDTLKKVRDVARAQGYRRNLRGVNLRTGRSFTLCAVLTSNPSLEFGDPAMMHLIQGLINAAETSEFKMVILPVGNEDEMQSALRETVESGRFEGVVIDHALSKDPRVSYLMEAQFPFVSFGRSDQANQHAYLDVDNRHAAYIATKDLITRGHRRIALLDGPAHYAFSQQRWQGYTDAMSEAGLTIDIDLVHFGSLRSSAIRQVLTTMFKHPSPPTGFVTANEVSTLAAVRICREQGLDLNDLGFVSRDGTRFFDYFQPLVNSCFHPILNSGAQLTNMLINVVGGKPVSELQFVEKATLVQRTAHKV